MPTRTKSRPGRRPARAARTAAPRRARATEILRPTLVGTDVPRLEGHDKVTGQARYVDDLHVPGALHGFTVRSTIPSGRIVKVSRDPAFDWTGVTVCDHTDIPGKNEVAVIELDQPLLAAGVVRHADEPVVLVAHADRDRAIAARDAIRIEYAATPPVLTVEDSIAKRSLIYGDDNVFKEIHIGRGDLDAGFAGADVIVEGEYRCGHQEQLYIENNGMIAERTREGGVTVRGSLQCPYYVHKALMHAFDLPGDKVRVIQAVTGGGFGGKEEYPSLIAAHAAVLAWKSRKPVKMIYDRLEDIAATTKRHPAVIRLRTGVTRDGRLVANDISVVMDGGAYMTLSPVVLSRGAIHAGGPYRCPNVRIHCRAVATNTPPNGAFRGFGAPQTMYGMECHMDAIAERLGLDPVELRRRNAYVIGDVTPTGQTLQESVGTMEVLERTVKRSNWAKRRAEYERFNADAEARERAGRATGRRLRRGAGFSLVYHGAGFTGSGEVKLNSMAAIDVTAEGRPRILTANTEIGQGTLTVFAQIVGQTLGIPAASVIVERADTGQVPDSGPTVASRTTMVVGGLLERCAGKLRDTLELFAERPVKDAKDFERIAKRWLAERGPLRIEQRYKKPAEIVWDDDHYRGDAYGVFSYAALAAEVEVDLDTYETRLLRVTTAQDIGKAIHPVLAAGQIEGGTVQGLGWALLEELRWKDGRVWNHQLTNYIIPTSADTPVLDVEIVELPYSKGPFGAKGVGELPMDGPAPAVVAAILHATGRHVTEIPVTPERLMHALADGRGR